MKTVIRNSLVSAALVLGTVAHADDQHHCNFELNYGLKVTPESVEFFDGKDAVLSISDDHVLRIDGDVVDLDHSSKKLVHDYQERIHLPLFRIQRMKLLVHFERLKR